MICKNGHEYADNEPYCSHPLCLSYEIDTLRTGKQLDGSVLMYVNGFKYPAHSIPDGDRLNATAATKRAFIATAFLFLRFPRAIFSFHPVKNTLRQVKWWIESIYDAEYIKHLIPDEELHPSSKELKRKAEKMWGKNKWIDCGILAYDTDWAYRGRVQDWFGILDQKKLAENPRKELQRVLDIALSREHTHDGDLRVKAKVRLLKKALNLMPYILPSIFTEIVEFLLTLDLEKVKMDINDRYWVSMRFDYDYEGKTYAERNAWREEEDKNWKQEIIEKPKEKPKIFINYPNQEFFESSKEIAEEMAENAKQSLINLYNEKKVTSRA